MINTNQPGRTVIRYSNRTRQRGIVLPLVVIGLLAIIAMAGLAIDSSHAFVNKTRLQNMVDAAALSAAKEYDETTDTILGAVAANANFGRNTDGSGNFEIDAAYDSGNISVVVQWSETLNPFVSTGIGPYVRVIASGFNMATGLVAVIGINSIDIAASAVAGPSPTINYACNIAPLVVCAGEPLVLEPGEEPPETDDYGFVKDALMVLKPTPGDHDDVGPGNYKLLRLECPGGACVRDAMAGSYEECASTEEPVETEPGVTAGPTSQGFNTRFDIYAGPISPEDYPPDVVITSSVDGNPPLETQQIEDPPGSGTYVDQICVGSCDDPNNVREFAYEDGIFDYWGDYHDLVTSYSGSYGVPWRRVLALPVADCTGDQTGQSTLEIIGFACYFMLQPIGGGQDKNIFGQFVKGCLAGGYSGINPGAGTGPYIIQLYKDPNSIDS